MPRLIWKIWGKSLQILRIYSSRILSIYRPLNTHVIHIDGGFGSQIMQFALYSRLKFEGKSAVLDGSYFLLSKESTNQEFVSIRTWELDAFNYRLADLPTRQGRKLRDSDFAKLYVPVYKRLFNDTSFLNSTFSLKQWRLSEVLNYLGLDESELKNTLSIHIRQGDFLRVASFLLKEEYYLEALDVAMQMSESTFKNIIFISDEEIDAKRFPTLNNFLNQKNKNLKTLKLVGLEPVLVHEFMRASGALICSNSNFSFSAAMLRNGKTSIYPSKFYEGDTAALNAIFKLPFGIEIEVT